MNWYNILWSGPWHAGLLEDHIFSISRFWTNFQLAQPMNIGYKKIMALFLNKSFDLRQCLLHLKVDWTGSEIVLYPSHHCWTVNFLQNLIMLKMTSQVYLACHGPLWGLSYQFKHQIKSTNMGYQKLKEFGDLSTYSWEKGCPESLTNFWTPCSRGGFVACKGDFQAHSWVRADRLTQDGSIVLYQVWNRQGR